MKLRGTTPCRIWSVRSSICNRWQVRYMRIHLPSRSTFKGLILDDKIDKAELVRAVKERPEQFGVLRGRSGLFGDNAERKQALSRAQGLSSHVGHAAETWDRRLQEALRSEEWQREKRDVVQVPVYRRRARRYSKRSISSTAGRSRSSLSG